MKTKKRKTAADKEQERLDAIATFKADLDATDADSKFVAFFAKVSDGEEMNSTIINKLSSARREYCVRALAELALDFSSLVNEAEMILRAASLYVAELAQARADKLQKTGTNAKNLERKQKLEKK